MLNRCTAPRERVMTQTSGRILVVEDEPIIAFALQDILQDLGWDTVAIAARLRQALDLIDAFVPDAAILDVNLRDEKSYPAADMLADRSIPFIFATGYGTTQHPERHRDVITLLKPYTQEDVQAALERA